MQKQLFLFAIAGVAATSAENPLGKVISLMNSLTAKIQREGEAEAKAYKEFVEWCDDVSSNKRNELKTAGATKDQLVATIAKAGDDAGASAGRVEDLAASISADDESLRSATEVRAKEEADFSASQAELVDSIDTLARAISIIGRQMAKNPAAFAQVDTHNMDSLVKSLTAVIDAASFASADRQRLVNLVQSSQNADSDDMDLDAPAAASYKSHSGGIMDVLEDLKEKAEEKLSGLRRAETTAKHNFAMLKQSLEDQIAADSKEMDEQKNAKAAAEELKATSEGKLAETEKDIADGKKSLATATSGCMQTAADHEATVNARNQELAVIAKAKEILSSSTGGAAEQSYSMFQISTDSRLRTRMDLANAEVVAVIKRLAKQQHSGTLAQLASRISSVLRFGASTGEDPFAKVRSMIVDMISKLESEGSADADEKAYCDEQMAKTEAKKTELEDDIARLTSKIDKAAANSAKAQAELKETQAELSALAKSQAEMDSVRSESNAAYMQAKSDLEAGLEGVRKALGVLRDYYGSAAAASMLETEESQPTVPQHTAASGAGNSIIEILEVVESDFAKDLAAEEAEESDAASEYDRQTQANTMTKTLKTQDVKYLTKEYQGLDKEISELSADRTTEGTQLSAVMDYYDKVKGRCIAKPTTYEDRRSRREAEIAGLKEALNILESETALVQRKKHGQQFLML